MLFEGYSTTAIKLDEIPKLLVASGAELTIQAGFACKFHGFEACYCGQLIDSLFSTSEQEGV
jgi:hypothetical protein